MTSAPTRPSPWDPVNGDVESYCWHPDGWESASEFSISDARERTRGQAAARFARWDFYGDITLVSVWKRYVRPLTRQDAWEYSGQERYADRLMDDQGIDVKWQPERKGQHDEWIHVNADTGEPVDMDALLPKLPPADWQPDWEMDPVWEFVHPDHPDAIPVWVCGERGIGKPPKPARKAAQ